MKIRSEILKNLTLITQFGFSFITPTIICIAVCWWLNSCRHVGSWIYLIGFFFGLGGSFTFAYKFYLSTVKDNKSKERKKETLCFNKHE